MAKIIPLQAKLSFHQTAGELYPVCIFSNDSFNQMFENALIVSKGFISPDSIEFSSIESILTGLSKYRVWKAGQDKEQVQLPEEITEHFQLLPEQDCNIEMFFKPYNNIPTEAFLYSHSEILNIVDALKMALDNSDDEQAEIIRPIFDSFNTFLTDWETHQQATGSYFANEKNI